MEASRICDRISCSHIRFLELMRSELLIQSFLKCDIVTFVRDYFLGIAFAHSHSKQSPSDEPPDDKTDTVSVRPAKTQISLGIHPV